MFIIFFLRLKIDGNHPKLEIKEKKIIPGSVEFPPLAVNLQSTQ